MSENTCPICSNGRLLERDGRFDTRYMDRRGSERVLTIPNVRRLACNACGEEILDDTASRQVEDARRVAMGLLSSAEIRELRVQFGRTQIQMSRLLGVGEKTYCRWESGAFVQSVAFDNYLRLLREIPQASAALMRLELGGTPGDLPSSQDQRSEFEFLENVNATAEMGTRFTRLMTAGTLYVPVHRTVPAEA